MADKKKQTKGENDSPDAAAGSGDVLRVATYPGARASIRTIKGWAGLGGFLVAFWLSYQAGVPFYWSALRAVLGGAVVYVVAWMAAVTFWRNYLVAKVETARVKALEEAEDEQPSALERAA